MMSKLFKIQMENTKTIKKITINNYSKYFEKLIFDTKINPPELFRPTNIDILFKWIDKTENIGTKLQKLSMMIKYCKLNNYDATLKLIKVNQIELIELRDKNKGKLTETKRQKWVSWENLIKMLNESKSKWNDYSWETWKKQEKVRKCILVQARETMILSMYLESVDNPPRRLVDYGLMRIAPKGVKEMDLDKNFNWCLIDSGFYIFNQYKTSKTYKQQKLYIDDKIIGYIKNYIEVAKIEDFLFPQTKNKKKPTAITYLGTMISKIIKKYTGKAGISVSMLRNIFVSNYLKDAPKKDKFNSIANKMGTSRDMLLYIYRHDIEKNGELVEKSIHNSI